MKQEILVPLDGSPLAEAVLPDALELARSTSSSLTLLNVVPTVKLIEPVVGAVNYGEEFWDTYEHKPDSARSYLARVAAHIAQNGFEVQTRVLEGDPAPAILSYASANPQVSFIAMATHGRSGLDRLVFGSVAETVMRSAPVPVLMYRSRLNGKQAVSSVAVQDRTYRRLLVPLDGSRLAEEALDEAKKLALATDASIILLSIASGADLDDLTNDTFVPLRFADVKDQQVQELSLYLAEIARRLREEGYKTKTRVTIGDPAEQIIAISEQEGVELIVMGTHGRGGLQRLWLGSVALTVAKGAERPVLLVRANTHSLKRSQIEKVEAPAGKAAIS
jgi:nucleotide-binding universal stress UspA family protein